MQNTKQSLEKKFKKREPYCVSIGAEGEWTLVQQQVKFAIGRGRSSGLVVIERGVAPMVLAKAGHFL